MCAIIMGLMWFFDCCHGAYGGAPPSIARQVESIALINIIKLKKIGKHYLTARKQTNTRKVAVMEFGV